MNKNAMLRQAGESNVGNVMSKCSLTTDTVEVSTMYAGSLFQDLKAWLANFEDMPSAIACNWYFKELLQSQA